MNASTVAADHAEVWDGEFCPEHDRVHRAAAERFAARRHAERDSWDAHCAPRRDDRAVAFASW